MDIQPSTFTADDRRSLIEMTVHVKNMRETMEKMEHKLGDEGSVQSRFTSLEAKVVDLQNFKYWILGAAAASGGMAGFIGSKIFQH